MVSRRCVLLETDQTVLSVTPHKDEPGTIGSRLRKRRWTGSSPVEGTSSKRPNLRQTMSPDNKRNTHTESHTREVTAAPPQVTMNGKQKASPEVEREITKTTIEPSEPSPVPPTSTSAPDLAAVIANIIDHGEHVDNHWATQGYGYDRMAVDTESWPSVGASLHLKIQSLPILDNLVGTRRPKASPHLLT